MIDPASAPLTAVSLRTEARTQVTRDSYCVVKAELPIF